MFWRLRQLRQVYRSPHRRALVGLGCIGLLLIATNVLAVHYLPLRFDMTEDRLYTLSPATRETLAEIDEPLALRFYYSPALGMAVAADGAYAVRVRVVLDQYVAAAHGKLRLAVLDPEPLSAAEAEAVAAGLTGVPLDGGGERGYFGLVGTNSTDDRQVIALFDPARERFLEFELTRLIRALAHPEDAGGAGEAALAALRSQQNSARPLTVIAALQRRAAARFGAEEQALRRRIAAGEAQLAAAGADATARRRLDLLAARRRLQAVIAAERQPVEQLEAIIAVADIAPAPLAVSLFALALAGRRRRARHPT